ncbi:MAG: FHA domain-containing protein [Alphaproteobacteria bacterium]|jgi:adenylate cyclase|nr:FHA domain-containing protein [Alphaproteobacteria bacterium]
MTEKASNREKPLPIGASRERGASRPDLAFPETSPKQRQAHERGVGATVLFADVVGSSRLYETAGDVEAKRKVAATLDAFEAIVRRYDGQPIKRIGDAVLATFSRPDDGLGAALTAQNEFLLSTVALAIGCLHGPVLFEEGDVHGDTVNVAAHLCKLAKAGEVLSTRRTVAGLRELPVQHQVLAPSFQPKGRHGRVEVVVVFADEASLERTGVATRSSLPQEILLTHRGRDFGLRTRDGGQLVLGRDDSCDVVIRHGLVSRRHAVLLVSGDHFILRDQSTNGTHVTPEAGQTLFVLRDHVYLHGSGTISLGARPGRLTDDLLFYRCQRA